MFDIKDFKRRAGFTHRNISPPLEEGETCNCGKLMRDAADEIERLRVECDAWKQAALHMKKIVRYGSSIAARDGYLLIEAAFAAAQSAEEKR